MFLLYNVIIQSSNVFRIIISGSTSSNRGKRVWMRNEVPFNLGKQTFSHHGKIAFSRTTVHCNRLQREREKKRLLA